MPEVLQKSAVGSRSASRPTVKSPPPTFDEVVDDVFADARGEAANGGAGEPPTPRASEELAQEIQTAQRAAKAEADRREQEALARMRDLARFD